MVSGFNVSVRHGGKVYHVQTEDRGRRNPVVETLVYEGGQILHQERVSYADQNDDEHYDEAAVARLVDLQHKRVIEAIHGGRFDEARPFGEEFISSRTFDECVLDFLVEESKNQSLTVAIVESSVDRGARAWVTVRASHHSSGDPIPEATIRSRLIRSTGGPAPLPEQKTGPDGVARVEFEVPAWEGHVAIIVQAESDFGRDEVQKLLW